MVLIRGASVRLRTRMRRWSFADAPRARPSSVLSKAVKRTVARTIILASYEKGMHAMTIVSENWALAATLFALMMGILGAYFMLLWYVLGSQ